MYLQLLFKRIFNYFNTKKLSKQAKQYSLELAPYILNTKVTEVKNGEHLTLLFKNRIKIEATRLRNSPIILYSFKVTSISINLPPKYNTEIIKCSRPELHNHFMFLANL